MEIQEVDTWFQSLRRFGIKPGLGRTRRVLQALGDPQTGLTFYHVAGTNGKGSVCAMLAALLAARQLRVGVYTSPGLGGYNGRMVVAGEAIADNDFARYATQVRRAMDDIGDDDPLTEFEVLTVMALLFFRDQAVDAVVWETGLGGRYDATNVVTPKVTAITNVTYDHVAILGPKLTDIAFDKSGIIKQGTPIVTGADGEAYRIIEQVAADVGAPVIRVGRDVSMTRTGLDERGQSAFYRGIYRDAGRVRLSLLGAHQLQNAAIALAMFELQHGALAAKDWRAAVNALAAVHWPMRFEVFAGSDGPVVLDAAHNPDAAQQLAKTLDDFSALSGRKSNWRMLIGIFADKDATSMLKAMLPRASEVIVCRPNHPRGAEPGEIAQMIRRIRPNLRVQIIPDVEQATNQALQAAEALVIWGCLHMVEDARKAISKLEMDYWT